MVNPYDFINLVGIFLLIMSCIVSLKIDQLFSTEL